MITEILSVSPRGTVASFELVKNKKQLGTDNYIDDAERQLRVDGRRS